MYKTIRIRYTQKPAIESRTVQLFWFLTISLFSISVPWWCTFFQIRVTLYLLWSLSEDEESQCKGLVGVICWPSSLEAVTPNNFAVMYSPREISRHIHLSNRMFECTPIRISCMHVCLPDEPIFHMFKAGMTLSMGAIRSRLKFHVGE